MFSLALCRTLPLYFHSGAQRRWRRRCISCRKILPEHGLAPSLMTAASLSARKWPGYCDSKLRLRELLENPGSELAAIANERDTLRARIKTILQRLESPSPDRYSILQWLDDRKWLLESTKKRESKVVLTEEDDAEEAHRMARADSFGAGPEVAAKPRLYELKDKERIFKSRGDRLTRKELTDLRLLGCFIRPPSPRSALIQTTTLITIRFAMRLLRRMAIYIRRNRDYGPRPAAQQMRKTTSRVTSMAIQTILKWKAGSFC